MAYVGETYRIYYIAKDFQTSLTDVKMVVYKPNGVKQGVYTLTELNLGDGKGIYYYDYTDSDVLGSYLFVINSPSISKKDARAVFFSDPLGGLVEAGITFRQALRVLLAVLAGKSSGGNTTSITFRDTNDTTDRIVATVDSGGNRTNVNLNLG